MQSPEEYEQILAEHRNSNTLLSQLVKYFSDKLFAFKKSKEEMIKLVIRKTQRHYKI